MKKNLLKDTPREDWTLEQLGQFVQQIAKRTAHDAWLLGRAYGIAKAKAKAERKKIEAWRKEWLPFLSQPTLSRYEAVAKLPEDDVRDKGLTDVYRLIGLAPHRTGHVAGDDAPSEQIPDGDSPQKARPAEDDQIPTDVARAGEPQQATSFKLVLAEPRSEPDSVLKRLASVVALLHSIVNDLPTLDVTDDATGAIHDAATLLNQIRAVVAKREVA